MGTITEKKTLGKRKGNRFGRKERYTENFQRFLKFSLSPQKNLIYIRISRDVYGFRRQKNSKFEFFFIGLLMESPYTLPN